MPTVNKRSPQIRLKKTTIRRLKETKNSSQKKLKTYDAVINYLYNIRDKYFKLKNKAP